MILSLRSIKETFQSHQSDKKQTIYNIILKKMKKRKEEEKILHEIFDEFNIKVAHTLIYQRPQLKSGYLLCMRSRKSLRQILYHGK